MEGREDFILTGQLGEVMRESARAGLSLDPCPRPRAWHPARGLREEHPAHPRAGGSHPQGRAVGRDHDGPGHRERPDRHPRPQGRRDDRRDHPARPGPPDRRAQEQDPRRPPSGAKMVILPRKNEKDLRDIPEEIRKSIKLVLVDNMEQVLEAALRRKPKPLVAEPPKVVKGDDPHRAHAGLARSVGRTSRRRTSRPSWSEAADHGHRCGDPMRRCRSGAQAVVRDGLQGLLRRPGSTEDGVTTEIKKAFRKLAREHHPDTNPVTPQRSGASRRSTRRTPSCPIPRSARSTTDSARTGRPTPGPAPARGRSGGPARGPRSRASPGSAARPAATSGTNSTRPGTPPTSVTSSTRSSPGVRPVQPVARATVRPGSWTRPPADRRPNLRGHPRGHGSRRAGCERRPAGRTAGQTGPRTAPPAAAEARRRDHPRRGLRGHDPPDRARGQAPRGHDPQGRRYRHAHPSLRQGAGRRRHPCRRPAGPRTARSPAAARTWSASCPSPSERPCWEPRSRSARPRAGSCSRSRPVPSPGRTFRLTGRGMPNFKGTGHGDLYVKARVVLPTDLADDARTAAAPSSTSPTNPIPAPESPDMQLDRFTQKAQEAILAAQATATAAPEPGP